MFGVCFRRASEADACERGGYCYVFLDFDLCRMHFVRVGVLSHQKLASRAKVWSAQSTPTPKIEYSPTNCFKKFVFPCKLNVSEWFQSLTLGEFIV